ncbi:hypothetical protein [Nitrospira sp. Nam80]
MQAHAGDEDALITSKLLGADAIVQDSLDEKALLQAMKPQLGPRGEAG